MDETSIEFPAEGVTSTAPVTQVGKRLYRLEGVPPLIESAGYLDVIEAEPIGDRAIRFVRIAERSGWRTLYFTAAADWRESDEGRARLAEIEARGGRWEGMFGGLLFVCVPPGSDPADFGITEPSSKPVAVPLSRRPWRRRKRTWAAALIAPLLVSGVAGFAFFVGPISRGRSLNAAYARVVPGMSEAAVASLMGDPDRVSDGASAAFWDDDLLPSDVADRVRREYRYTVTTFFLPISWAVGFDESGRAVTKHRFD